MRGRRAEVGQALNHEGIAVRTTAEVLLALLPGWDYSREPDARTGGSELVIRRAG